MINEEIIRALKFTRRWFELGIVDDAWIALAVRAYRETGDDSDEHYRYGAFVEFLRRTPALTPQQCHDLFALGADESDSTMGTSIMLDVLRRLDCPDELYAAAAAHPFTKKHAAEMLSRRDESRVAAQRRKEVQASGPERYYREHGFKNHGGYRKDESVFAEMQALFGIDWKQFHKIKNATPRPDGNA